MKSNEYLVCGLNSFECFDTDVGWFCFWEVGTTSNNLKKEGQITKMEGISAVVLVIHFVFFSAQLNW